MNTRIDSLVASGIRRWSAFTPTADAPSPGTQLDANKSATWHALVAEHGGHESVDDFHDVSAVLAGRKPAAWVDANWLAHPVGKAQADRARSAGLAVRQWGPHAAIGNPASVDALQRAVKEGEDRGKRSPAEHAAIGTALGYPADAIEKFRKRISRVRLARGDAEEQSFQQQMHDRPTDRNVRLVYADWLQEHGDEKAAQRLRWWTRLMGVLEGPSSGIVEYDSRLPHWAQRLATIHRIHRALAGLPRKPTGRVIDLTRRLLSSAERDAIGVEDGNRYVALARESEAVIPGLWRRATGGRNYDQPVHRASRIAYAAYHAHGARTYNREDAGSLSRSLNFANAWLDSPELAAYRTADENRHAAGDDPVRLAAISPPDPTAPSVLVKVPVPTPVEEKKPVPAPAPKPASPPVRGPVFFLPQ